MFSIIFGHTPMKTGMLSTEKERAFCCGFTLKGFGRKKTVPNDELRLQQREILRNAEHRLQNFTTDSGKMDQARILLEELLIKPGVTG